MKFKTRLLVEPNPYMYYRYKCITVNGINLIGVKWIIVSIKNNKTSGLFDLQLTIVIQWITTDLSSAVACCRDGSGRELTVENSGRRRGGRQCGLCSLVARAFRRAVCGAPSRRGSGDSYQELTPQPVEEENATVSIYESSLCPTNFISEVIYIKCTMYLLQLEFLYLHKSSYRFFWKK